MTRALPGRKEQGGEGRGGFGAQGSEWANCIGWAQKRPRKAHPTRGSKGGQRIEGPKANRIIQFIQKSTVGEVEVPYISSECHFTEMAEMISPALSRFSMLDEEGKEFE